MRALARDLAAPSAHAQARLARDRVLPFVLVGTLLSRLLYHALGVRPDLSTLPYFWQFLDPELLEHDLWRSVFYDHAQPPLYNLFLGAHVRADDPALAFLLSGLALALLLHGGLYALLRRLGTRRFGAATATLLFAFSPASILYERWVFYSFPVAALLVLGALFAHRAVARGSARAAALAFVLFALVTLVRSLFHPLWLLAVLVTVLAFARPSRRRALLWAALPGLLLAASVPAKNLALYGRPTASSWLGMSVAKLAVAEAPGPVRRAKVREGALSRLSLVGPFAELRRYPSAWRAVPADWPEHPVIRAPYKSNGHPNYHHAAYVRIAERFMADARVMLEDHPEVYGESVRKAAEIFWKPTTDYAFLAPNRAHLGPLPRIYDALWGVPYAFAGDETRAAWGPRSWPHVAWGWLALVLLAALWALWRTFVPGPESRATRATLTLLGGTALYVWLVSSVVEIGENNRFRFLVEPLLFALVVAASSRALRALGRLRWR
ncbi:MAG TPA: hypothetical protein RMH26_32015, partial [Polyangiaceae bacterium LLY-WYZ-15_(1-7)]|nr:hypothetical protein [Polyangiaceae bacterium LLY-WYZ-15_(1-7)]